MARVLMKSFRAATGFLHGANFNETITGGGRIFDCMSFNEIILGGGRIFNCMGYNEIIQSFLTAGRFLHDAGLMKTQAKRQEVFLSLSHAFY